MNNNFFKKIFNFKNEDGTTNKKKGCLVVIAVYAIFQILMLIFALIGGSIENNKKVKIAELIEKEDYSAARKALSKHEGWSKGDELKKITMAQVASLIDKGQLNLASQIATEDDNYDAYYEALMSKLVQLYNSNKAELFVALSTIQFESVTNGCYPMNIIHKNEIIKGYNSNIAQLMLYAKTIGNLDDVKQLGDFLKPQHKEKNVNGEKEYLGQIDYTDANRIRKEFGLKAK